MDAVLYNGKVVTVDARFTIAEAVAVTRDRIEAVGSSTEMLSLAGSDTRRIDLEGRTVLPGLIDAHLHPTTASTSELFEEIPDVRTLDDLLAYIEARAAEKEKETWIVHPKFLPTRIVEMRQPTLQELDRVAPEHPVFLNGSYGGMISSRAIRICGIAELSEHPGILRDGATGEPTGLIRASAFPLVTRHLPRRELSYERELVYEDADAMTYVLGPRRARWFLPLRSMRDAGMILNGGSDHMVKLDSHTSINPYNPFLGMWIAITRTTERGSVIRPDEALTREEALRMYTIDNAYGTFEEDVKGSIEPGKLADMIVISEDYLTCPVDAIRTIRVEKTIVGGKVVYERR